MISLQTSCLPTFVFLAYKATKLQQPLPQAERSTHTEILFGSYLPSNWMLKTKAYRANNEALTAHSQNDIAKAGKKYQESLILYKKAYGENHPFIAGVLYNLADLYHTEQRYSEAEQYYWQAYRLEKENYGDAHPRTIQTMQNLAALYHDTHRPNEAKVKYLQVLDAQTKAFPPDNLAIAKTLGDLAALLHEQNDYENAKHNYCQAIALFQQLSNKAETERMQRNLAKLEEMQISL